MTRSPLDLRREITRRLAELDHRLPTSTVGRAARTALAFTRGGGLTLRRSLLRRLGLGSGEASLESLVAVVESLGQLKGIGMKAGQLLSVVDLALPEELRTALSVLQTQAPAMPIRTVRDIVSADLGLEGNALLATMRSTPVAAASIGQVHRATLPDGTAVAVKVLYPGIAEAIARDFGPARRGSALAAWIYPGAKVDAFIDEARARFLEECDYSHEAVQQLRFAEIYAGHPVLVVPAVHATYCASRVLTTTWIDGLHLDAYLETHPDQAARNRAGEALFEFYLGSLFRDGLYNCDPHPGNYLFTEDGRVAVLDFGCTREFTPEFVGKLANLTAAAQSDDVTALRTAMLDLGLVRAGATHDDGFIRSLVRAFYGPMLVDEQTAFNEDDELRVRELLRSKRALLQLALPGELLFLLRIRFGMAAVLARLGARANWHRLAAHWRDQRRAITPPEVAEAAASPASHKRRVARPVPAAPAGPALFDLVLVDPGSAVIQVIREIREATGLPLKDIKELVDSRPQAIRQAVPRDDAEALQRCLAAAGAETEIRPVVH